jgi:hypothetical protein
VTGKGRSFQGPGRAAAATPPPILAKANNGEYTPTPPPTYQPCSLTSSRRQHEASIRMRNFPPLREWRLPRLRGTVSVLRSFTKLIPPGQVTAGSPSKRKSPTPLNVVRVGPPGFALCKSSSTPPTGHRRFQHSVSRGFDLVHGDHRSSFVARCCGSNSAYCCSSRLVSIFCFFNRSDHLVHSPEGRAPWMSSETMSTPVRNTRKPCLRPPC